MAREPRTFDGCLLRFRNTMESEHLAPRTISFYVETVHAVTEILRAGNRHVMPAEITREDVDYLLDYFVEHDFAIQTRKGYLSALRKWCRTSNVGSPAVHDWPNCRFPHDTRPHADWLTCDQAASLLTHPKTQLQAVVVHLELCLGMRHCEVIRLRADAIDYSREYLTVTGKGSMGGKPRIIPFTKGTADLLRTYTETVRDEQIRRAKARFPISTTVPPNLILWSRGDRLHAYSEEGYGLDKMVTIPLSEELGFHFSNHTLRRTFGRALFRAGVAVPVIAKILGHESTDVTLRYIGVDLDDMTDALRRLSYD